MNGREGAVPVTENVNAFEDTAESQGMSVVEEKPLKDWSANVATPVIPRNLQFYKHEPTTPR